MMLDASFVDALPSASSKALCVTRIHLSAGQNCTDVRFFKSNDFEYNIRYSQFSNFGFWFSVSCPQFCPKLQLQRCPGCLYSLGKNHPNSVSIYGLLDRILRWIPVSGVSARGYAFSFAIGQSITRRFRSEVHHRQALFEMRAQARMQKRAWR